MPSQDLQSAGSSRVVSVIAEDPAPKMNKALLISVILSACLSSMIFGLVLAGTNSCMNFIVLSFDTCGPVEKHGEVEFYPFQCTEMSLYSSIQNGLVMIGAGCGSYVGGQFSDWAGRRGAMFKLNVAAFAGYALCSFANGWIMFLIGRAIAGLIIGAVSVAVPMYIGEMVPSDVRGSFGVLHQLFITSGILVGIALGLASTQTIDFSANLIRKSEVTSFDLIWWRFIVGFGAFPSALSVLMMGIVFRKMESPTWLVRKGRVEEAKQSLLAVKEYACDSSDLAMSAPRPSAEPLVSRRPSENLETGGGRAAATSSSHPQTVEQEIAQLEQALEKSAQMGEKTWIWACKSKYYRVGVFLGFTLSALQQLSGINVIVTQSNTMFSQVADIKYVTLLSSGVGLVNVVMTVAAIPIIDRMGRRNILIMSSAGMMCAMGLALVGYILGMDGVDLMPHAASQWIVTGMIFVFIIFFAVGFGPVVWIYLSEIYPSNLRGSCLGMGIAVNWGTSAAVVFGIGAVLSSPLVTYSVFTVTNLLGLIFVLKFVVETRGTDIEDSPVYAGREMDADEDDETMAVTGETASFAGGCEAELVVRDSEASTRTSSLEEGSMNNNRVK